MATFPTLTPSSRTFTPGRHPHSEIPTLNGLQTRVRTSNVILEQRLRLTFIGLTEAQMLSIRTHYVGQQGRFLSFRHPHQPAQRDDHAGQLHPNWLQLDLWQRTAG
jgi:hypothetical protein